MRARSPRMIASEIVEDFVPSKCAAANQLLRLRPVHLHVARPHRRELRLPVELADLRANQNRVALAETERRCVLPRDEHVVATRARQWILRAVDHRVELFPATSR